MKNLIVVLLIALAITSCESQDNAAANTNGKANTISKTQYKNGPCGESILNELRSAEISCEAVVDDESLLLCEEAFTKIKESYPEINCTAVMYDEEEQESYEFEVTEELLEEILKEISSMYE